MGLYDVLRREAGAELYSNCHAVFIRGKHIRQEMGARRNGF